METQLQRILSSCVVVLMLLVVHSMAAPVDSCVYNLTKSSSTAQLLLDPSSKNLLNYYTNLTRNFSDTTSDDLPDPSISGSNFSMKFQDIYNKTQLFFLHMEKVEEYQKELWAHVQPLKPFLDPVKRHFTSLSAWLENIMTGWKPPIPVPTKPDRLKLNHGGDYDKRMYIWHAINRVILWLPHVIKFLEEGKELCDK